MRFSTLRFLRISVQRTRRRKYVEDLSLLIVRVAVLLLIAAGLARPALVGLASLWARRTHLGDRDRARQLGQHGRDRRRADPVRDRPARRSSRSWRDCARATSWPCCRPAGPPAPELGRLFRTHETVRQALDQCRPSYERADLAARIQQAATCWPRPRLPARRSMSSPTTRAFPGKASRSRSPRMIRRDARRPRGRRCPWSWSTSRAIRCPTWPSRRSPWTARRRWPVPRFKPPSRSRIPRRCRSRSTWSCTSTA